VLAGAGWDEVVALACEGQAPIDLAEEVAP
jgi:hypothetical protein